MIRLSIKESSAYAYVFDALGWVWECCYRLPWYESWRMIRFHEVAMMLKHGRIKLREMPSTIVSVMDALCERMDEDDRAYLIMVSHGTGIQCRSNFDKWPTYHGRTKEHEALLAAETVMNSDKERLLILTEQERSALVGACDTFATLLADKKHQWTDAERAQYEQACEILKVESPEITHNENDN